MKGLYITFEPLIISSGVSKKVLSQCNGFRENDVEVDLYCQKLINGTWFAAINDIPFYSLGKGFVKGIKYRICFNYLYSKIVERQYNFVYIRYNQIANPFFIRFLKKVRENDTRIFIEVPTYPYDEEYLRLSFIYRSIILKIEKKSRVSFKNYVNRIVTVQNYEEIFNIPTIKISNCVDTNKIPLREMLSHRGFNILGVANLGFWHGYDRLLEGLGLYYKNGGIEDVNFYIVGDNHKVINEYLSIVKKYNIESKVHFEGPKEGHELNTYFDKADLAIGSLAGHRKGLTDAKPLKCVEYASRGIPFIYSEHNSDFDACYFVKRVPENDTPIDIYELISFVSNLKYDPKELRNFVEENLTWDKQMKKVLSAI